MIYTIGNRINYTKYFKEAVDKGIPVQKLGRNDPLALKDNYGGGIVWLNREDADKYLQDNGRDDYSVYGVEADWEKDVEISKIAPEFGALLNTSNLIQINND